MTFLATLVVSAVLRLNLCLLVNLDLSPPSFAFPNRGPRDQGLPIPFPYSNLDRELGDETLPWTVGSGWAGNVPAVVPRPLPLSQLCSVLRLRP